MTTANLLQIFCARFDARKRKSRLPRPRPTCFESLETRALYSTTTPTAYESADGSGNNVANSTWGAAGSDLIRLASAAYADGISAPSLPNDLSARDISNLVSDQSNPADPSTDINTVNSLDLTDFSYTFGQFIDHDLDLTNADGASDPIAVDPSDPIGPASLAFNRSDYDPTTGTTDARQQTTLVTSYLDLSQVYGSDTATADALRTFSGGQMKTSPGDMLPYLNSTYFTADQLANFNTLAGGEVDQGALPSTDLFATGDVRGNENSELTSIQTLFVRNHNKIAAQLQIDHPDWTDEQLYQEARKVNIAEYQNIIYTQWIPDVFGQNALAPYTGYNPNVNATISNEFSTVAFRFGHSLLDNEVERQDNNGQDISVSSGTADVSIDADFFDANLLSSSSTVDPYTGDVSADIDSYLKANADGIAQENDVYVASGIRNFIFGPGEGGQDILSLDIQRGRDHGIPDYNDLRVALGLPAVTSFAQITSDVSVQQKLEEAYPGGVNTIDAFVGGLAEDHVPGSDVGPLFQTIIINQFSRLRDGDRYFYLNEQFTPDELAMIGQSNTLAQVIEANTSITNLQPDVFVFNASISGNVKITSPLDPRQSPALAPFSVQLKDSDGNVVASTFTDSRGNYTFSQISGPLADSSNGPIQTGTYTVSLILPNGATLTQSPTASINITRGDTYIMGINFGVSLANSNTGGSGSTNPTQPPAPPHAPPPRPTPPPKFQAPQPPPPPPHNAPPTGPIGSGSSSGAYSGSSNTGSSNSAPTGQAPTGSQTGSTNTPPLLPPPPPGGSNNNPPPMGPPPPGPGQNSSAPPVSGNLMAAAAMSPPTSLGVAFIPAGQNSNTPVLTNSIAWAGSNDDSDHKHNSTNLS